MDRDTYYKKGEMLGHFNKPGGRPTPSSLEDGNSQAGKHNQETAQPIVEAGEELSD